ncbi:MAG TPA: ABC transporter ATP-binding protein [Thermoanaerobaculia bacterium]
MADRRDPPSSGRRHDPRGGRRFFFAYFFRLSLNGLSSILSGYAGQRVVFRTRLELLRHVQRLSAEYHKKTPVGDLLHRIEQDVQQIEELGGTLVVSVVRIVVTTGLTLAIMLVLNWKLTLIVLPLVFVAVYTRRYGQPRLRKLSDDVQKTAAQRSSLLQEVLSSVQQIQLLRRETAEARRYAGIARRGIDLSIRRRGGELLLGLTNILVTVAGTALVLGFGGQQVLAGALTIGGLVAFYTFLSRLFEPVENITSMYAQYQRASASIRRVQQVLRETPAIRDDADARPLPVPVRGAVAVRGVSFRYEADRSILRDVSFEVEPGQSLAILGPTGSGKSTIANLITRLYDPQAGAVLLDGCDVRRLHLRELRDVVAVVPQEPLLFNATLRENLLLARKRATREEIDAVVHMAQLDETLSHLPQGLETPVGPRGGLLSGGERQRVAIARAILQRPQVLILDEATSALDGPTEQRLLTALRAFGRDCTMLVIAHRLAPILWADRSLFLEDGAVVAYGRHDDLFQSSPRYREFLEQQLWRERGDGVPSAVGVEAFA